MRRKFNNLQEASLGASEYFQKYYGDHLQNTGEVIPTHTEDIPLLENYAFVEFTSKGLSRLEDTFICLVKKT